MSENARRPTLISAEESGPDETKSHDKRKGFLLLDITNPLAKSPPESLTCTRMFEGG